MASTLGILWMLARWAGRGLARAGRAAFAAGRALGPILGGPAPGDWLSRAAAEQHWPAGLEQEIRRLAQIYRDSFCGECAGGPDYPQGRCPKCIERLGGLLTEHRAGGRAA